VVYGITIPVQEPLLCRGSFLDGFVLLVFILALSAPVFAFFTSMSSTGESSLELTLVLITIPTVVSFWVQK
jgi:hypothetical protein